MYNDNLKNIVYDLMEPRFNYNCLLKLNEVKWHIKFMFGYINENNIYLVKKYKDIICSTLINIFHFKNVTLIKKNKILTPDKINKKIMKIIKKNKYISKMKYNNNIYKSKNTNDANLHKAIKLSLKSLPNEINKDKQKIINYNKNNNYFNINNINDNPQNLIKLCPYCKIKIIRGKGCSHMKCTVCKNDFYWENALNC